MRTRKRSKNLTEKSLGKTGGRKLRAKHTGNSSSCSVSDRDAPAVRSSGDYLDIGSGKGELLRCSSALSISALCLRLHRSIALRPGPRIDTVDLNREPLPYSDNRFALVTCIETIEHLENYRAVIREIYRVLAPGGVAIFSTPNILNLRSRLRFFSSGFYNLFGPLRLTNLIFAHAGHINPVKWFYLSHALLSFGFRD